MAVLPVAAFLGVRILRHFGADRWRIGGPPGSPDPAVEALWRFRRLLHSCEQRHHS
jgi:hypothetical protein